MRIYIYIYMRVYGEVKDFVRKARAKSTSGINGISYKLYKRCPEVLTSLWKLL